MTSLEKQALIEKLMKPEASDGAAFGVLGLGALILGSSITSVAIPAAFATTIAIAGPTLLVTGVGGVSYLAIRSFLNRRKGA